MDTFNFKLTQFMTNSFFQELFLNEFNKHMKIYNNKNTDTWPWGDLTYINLRPLWTLKSSLAPFTIPEGCLELTGGQVGG